MEIKFKYNNKTFVAIASSFQFDVNNPSTFKFRVKAKERRNAYGYNSWGRRYKKQWFFKSFNIPVLDIKEISYRDDDEHGWKSILKVSKEDTLKILKGKLKDLGNKLHDLEIWA